jgi:hypothetical protein
MYKKDNVWSACNYWFYPKAGVPQSPPVIEKRPMPLTGAGSVKELVGADILNNNANGSGAVAEAALQVAANALDNPNHPANREAAIIQAFLDALNTSITQDQKTTIEGQLGTAGSTPEAVAPDYNQLTPAQISAAVTAALSGQGLSANQIAAAIAASTSAQTNGLTQAQLASSLASAGLSASQIAAAIAAAGGSGLTQAQSQAATKAAIDDETGVSTPIDPNILLPDKLSLTVILTSFMNTIKNMAFIETLQGITIQCSGSPILCVNLPSKYGGNVCYNASGIESSLNMIGTVLLSMMTIVMFIYIFRSN